MFEFGDDRKEFGHRRDAAHKSRGNNRLTRRGAPPHGRLLQEQAVATIGRVECAFGGEYVGPVLRQNFEEAPHDLPVLGHAFRNEILDALEARSLGRHAVEQACKACREGRSLSGKKRIFPAAFTPMQDQSCQQQTPTQLGNRRWHTQRAVVCHSVDERQLL